MKLVEVSNNKTHKIEISKVDEADFAAITKKRYFFDWKLVTC